ncbi:MAG: endo-1,4-beta-xylanase, partial [Bacteroidota bacterium]
MIPAPFKISILISLYFLAAGEVFAQSEAWRVAAQERIEQHRMGTIDIMVRDDDGNPVPNAAVEVRMLRHAFGFGTAISSGMLNNTRIPEYRDKVADLTGDGRTFNLAVFENAMKWPQWEGSTNKSLIRNQVLWMNSRGMDVRGHNLLWPGSQWLPADIVESTDAEYISGRIETHIRSLAGYSGIKGRILEWDV